MESGGREEGIGGDVDLFAFDNATYTLDYSSSGVFSLYV